MRASYHVYLLTLLASLAIIRETQAVEYVVYNRAENTPGGLIFEERLKQNAVPVMKLSTNHIWKIFGMTDSSKHRVQVNKIVLYIQQFEKNSRSVVEGGIGRVYINPYYIADSSPEDEGSDFMDIVYYELTHILLWKAEDRIPAAIKDGIAAFIVLDTGTGKPRGVVELGEGNAWDDNCYVTARFLQFCSKVLCTDFVPKLNKKMNDSCSYEENYFFQLTKKSRSEAWTAYKDKYKPRVW